MTGAPNDVRRIRGVSNDALQHELSATDTTRLALWGSSFSGGTALVTAARRDDVRAVIAQCPYLKTPPELEPYGFALVRYVLLTVLDLLRVFPPVYVPLFGRPGEWAFATSRENPSAAHFGGPLGSVHAENARRQADFLANLTGARAARP